MLDSFMPNFNIHLYPLPPSIVISLSILFSTISLLQTWCLLSSFQFIIQMQTGAVEFCIT